MNDSAGNKSVVDNIGANTGTAIQNTSVISTNGKINTALHFDGSSDYITTTTHFTSVLTNSCTFLFWTYLEDGQPAVETYFVWDFHGDYSSYFGLVLTTVGALRLYYVNPTFNNNPSVTTFTFSNGDQGWHHIAIVLNNANTSQFYVDGVFRPEGAEATNEFTLYSSETCTIGTRTDTSGYLGGRLDDFRVYKRALSSNEVFTIWNGGNGTEDSSLTVGSDGYLQSKTWNTATSNNCTSLLLLTDKAAIPATTNFLFRQSVDNGSHWSNVTLTAQGAWAPDTNYYRWTGTRLFDYYGTQVLYKAVWSNGWNGKLKGVVQYVEDYIP
jgi:hypothetical protein